MCVSPAVCSVAATVTIIINGVVAVPVIAAMMVMTTDHRIMGRFKIHGALSVLGWMTLAAMTAAVVTMAASLFQ
jgi:Mn2+/Fe2+ NRAMP family transporter